MLSEERLWKLVPTATLLGAAMMLVMVLVFSVPVFGQGPTKPPNENFGGNTTSQYHRSNESGKGNFGQCHRTGFVEGEDSSTFNPSAQNEGESDCRRVAGFGVAATTFCPGSVEQYAEAQIIFQPELGFAFRTDCP